MKGVVVSCEEGKGCLSPLFDGYKGETNVGDWSCWITGMSRFKT